METFEKQVEAVRAAYTLRALSSEEAAEILSVAEEALDLGLPPIQAITAAAAKLNPGLMGLEVSERNVLMVGATNGLLGAEGVRLLGPIGLMPCSWPHGLTPVPLAERRKSG